MNTDNHQLLTSSFRGLIKMSNQLPNQSGGWSLFFLANGTVDTQLYYILDDI